MIISNPSPSFRVLTYTDISSYLFTIVFVACSVTVPWIFHQYHLAGPTYLPMHYFVLLGGLIFGWRSGLIIGALTPLISYGISGMPALPVLPQIIIEVSTYGLVAGLLREKFQLRIFWSLLGAMVAGRLTLLSTISILSFFGTAHSPLGAESGILAAFWSTLNQGLPGIAVQLIVISVVTLVYDEIISRTKNTGAH